MFWSAVDEITSFSSAGFGTMTRERGRDTRITSSRRRFNDADGKTTAFGIRTIYQEFTRVFLGMVGDVTKMTGCVMDG